MAATQSGGKTAAKHNTVGQKCQPHSKLEDKICTLMSWVCNSVGSRTWNTNATAADAYSWAAVVLPVLSVGSTPIDKPQHFLNLIAHEKVTGHIWASYYPCPDVNATGHMIFQGQLQSNMSIRSASTMLAYTSHCHARLQHVLQLIDE